ncbi:hypothetical protein VKT23_007775 [Stygiomarasmius scandens]|uniref:Uncharacterized protein n=1 Tax=Marasmiellus scandens TaxID=2682957 RepID=A0ABR1JLN2_9AGAR
MDLGKIQSSSQPVYWSLGLVRDPVIQYAPAPGQSQARRPYFYSDPRFSSQKIDDVVDFFLEDYESAVLRAEDLDARVLQDTASAAAGKEEEYFNLVSLGARQTLAGFDITFTATQDNNSDIKAFTKNTGVAGISNNVPTLYASLPAFLYFNASWAGYLLEPLLQYKDSLLPEDRAVAASDLGAYPKASGNNGRSGVEGIQYQVLATNAHTRLI